MIGRKHEIEELERLYNSGKAELVAVYGRRRVGKTFLIDETFDGRFSFRHAGLSPTTKKTGALKAQLLNFAHSLIDAGAEVHHVPENWMDAFFLLEQFLKTVDKKERQLIFFDELPWMDTPRSGFVTAFEAFWNNWGCHRKNLMVIVCGSANSWILDHFINDHGGLYNRVTYEIKLSPFTLAECEEFYKCNGVNFSRYDIAQSYMILGGIPYYLGYIEKGRSLAQNIDNLLFSKNAKLGNEYDRLFSSVFSNSEFMKQITEILYSKSSGFTRTELLSHLGISDGSALSQALKALEASDFVEKYRPFGEKGKSERYKLIDPFCLFYLHFIYKKNRLNENFWQQNQTSQQIVTWRGFAFERVCFEHIAQIKSALGISGVITTRSAWIKRGDDTDGTQIDLLISRNDNVINLCEIKYYGGNYTVDKNSYRNVLHRQELLLKEISPKMSIHTTLITTFGLTGNEYSGVFTNVVTLDDLFFCRR